MSAVAKLRDDIEESEVRPLSFAVLLRDLDNGDAPLPDPAVDSGAAFRYVYDGFVQRGDYERGKPRHAVRQIKEWLGENQVRSLETKLAGKTRLKYKDAHCLLKLFLSRWTYNKAENSYEPLSAGDLDKLAGIFLKDLFPGDVNSILLPDRSRSTNVAANSETTQLTGQSSAVEMTRPSGAVIREDFTSGDALVTVSRVRTIIDTNPARAMTGFNLLMADLREIDQRDERQRVAIWVIDLGLRNEKESARGAIYNVQLLAAQFHAIAITEAPSQEDTSQEDSYQEDEGSYEEAHDHVVSGQRDLYDWLQKNACIIVGSLSKDEIDDIYSKADVGPSTKKQDRPWFQSDRLFLESVPGRWLDDNVSTAFGVPQGELWQMPTITAHLRLENWEDADHPAEVDRRRNLRYFFHSSIEAVNGNEDPARCIQLPEPGARWSDAYRLACNAAFLRLGYASEKRLSHVGTPEEALALLRDQHFAALTLEEFLDLPRYLSKRLTKH